MDDTLGRFFNKLFENMQDTYRELLMSKSKDELAALATKKGIYVNKHKPLEAIVDRIMDKIMTPSS